MTARSKYIVMGKKPDGRKEFVVQYILACNSEILTGSKCKNSWRDELFGPVDEARGRAAKLGWVHGRYRLRSSDGLFSWHARDFCPEHAHLAPPADPKPPYRAPEFINADE